MTSRHACERATIPTSKPAAVINVSIRARARAGDEGSHDHCHSFALVSIRARARAGDQGQALLAGGFVVSIHAQVRVGDLVYLLPTKCSLWFQSSPAHERATVEAGADVALILVSIRARASGRLGDLFCGRQDVVSILTRVRAGDDRGHAGAGRYDVSIRARAGETYSAAADCLARGSFNPRPRVSGQPSCGAVLLVRLLVSILTQHGAHRSHDSVCSFSFGVQTSNGRCSAGASIAKSRRAVFSFPLGPLWKAHFQLSASGGAPSVRALLQITTDNGAAMACAVATPIRRTG
jgi:hypothetical protein